MARRRSEYWRESINLNRIASRFSFSPLNSLRIDLTVLSLSCGDCWKECTPRSHIWWHENSAAFQVTSRAHKERDERKADYVFISVQRRSLWDTNQSIAYGRASICSVSLSFAKIHQQMGDQPCFYWCLAFALFYIIGAELLIYASACYFYKRIVQKYPLFDIRDAIYTFTVIHYYCTWTGRTCSPIKFSSFFFISLPLFISRFNDQ